MRGMIEILETLRLKLRPLQMADAPLVSKLAGEKAIASTTRRIPHPYTLEMAENWVASLPELHAKGELLNYAIVLQSTGEFIGSIGLILNATDHHGELGYWIGSPYWNRGYATEAALKMVDYAFEGMQLHRIFALHMTRNPASGRVMQKIGMKKEGTLKEHRYKWGKYEDLAMYGMTEKDYRTHLKSKG
jgi:[ribosomal protein S5]-alanine N-acetyltransferase